MTSQATFESKPYKGPLSYEIEDSDYFFGRDREADLLTAKILSSRLTFCTLPLRYVISMRDEYIAQLDPLRRFVRDLDANAFHLSFLEKDEALAAIREPARLFGYA